MDEGSVLESTGDPALDDALAQLADAVAVVNGFDLTSLVRLDSPSTGLHAAGRVVETVRRQLTVFDSHYVSAVETGNEPARYANSSTTVFLRDQLRISASEARRRITIAHATQPQPGFSGADIPARLPVLAQALEAGAVSADHAHAAIATMDKIPAGLPIEARNVCEAELVASALICDPTRLARFGQAVIDRADPDGALRDYDHAHAHRGLDLTPHRIGAGGHLTGDLNVELLEKLQTGLDSLAAPQPTTHTIADADGMERIVETPDPRTARERRHDALLALIDLALNSGQLPACGGTPATVVFHLTAPDSTDDLTDRSRMASTEHGHRIPVPDALTIANQAVLYFLTKDTKNVPLQLGRTSRLATPAQTIALAARDHGCSFPGCDRPPNLCQRHHITQWQAGGPTNLDNLTLLCGYHHREFARQGWQVAMTDRHPWWTPPTWIDPHQHPLRNHAHPPLPDTG